MKRKIVKRKDFTKVRYIIGAKVCFKDILRIYYYIYIEKFPVIVLAWFHFKAGFPLLGCVDVYYATL